MSDDYGDCLTPATYPAQCEVTAEELQELKELFDDPDRELGQYVHTEWPPRDESGNVYEICFTPDDLTERCDLRDSNYNPYNPFGGNLEPAVREEGAVCNTPLNNWRDRYPNIRFCGRYTDPDYTTDEAGYFTHCPVHRNRKSMTKSAEEVMQTGAYVKTVDHLYDKLSPWKKIVGWGTFESLMGESTYEYGVEYHERELDFSEEPIVPDDVDEDGVLSVKMGYPTDYGDRALSLYVAAMKTVQMISVQPQIMEEDPEEGVGMMEAKSIESAQLTAPPTEHDPSPQQFKTLETVGEHHLNLPLSRLITDRPKLLEYGGVPTDAEAEEDDVSADDIVLEIEADPESVGTTDTEPSDPNSFENYTSQSEQIVESTSDE